MRQAVVRTGSQLTTSLARQGPHLFPRSMRHFHRPPPGRGLAIVSRPRHATTLALLLLSTTATGLTCSSLDGPFCPHVNGPDPYDLKTGLYDSNDGAGYGGGTDGDARRTTAASLSDMMGDLRGWLRSRGEKGGQHGSRGASAGSRTRAGGRTSASSRASAGSRTSSANSDSGDSDSDHGNHDVPPSEPSSEDVREYLESMGAAAGLPSNLAAILREMPPSVMSEAHAAAEEFMRRQRSGEKKTKKKRAGKKTGTKGMKGTKPGASSRSAQVADALEELMAGRDGGDGNDILYDIIARLQTDTERADGGFEQQKKKKRDARRRRRQQAALKKLKKEKKGKKKTQKQSSLPEKKTKKKMRKSNRIRREEGPS